MKTKSGTSRIVFLFGNFVIKLPRIMIIKGFKQLFSNFRRERNYFLQHGYKEYRERGKRYREMGLRLKNDYLIQGKKYPKKYQRTGEATPQKFWFYGIISNWQEYLFYQKNKLEILVPTYFSFFGLINIQKRGPELEIGGFVFEGYLLKILGDDKDDFLCDNHTLSNPKNFCQDKSGKLAIFDYGNSMIHDFLKKHGQTIREKLIIS